LFGKDPVEATTTGKKFTTRSFIIYSQQVLFERPKKRTSYLGHVARMGAKNVRNAYIASIKEKREGKKSFARSRHR
jgi:hypothetical protein